MERRLHRVPRRDAAAAARQPHSRRRLRRGHRRGQHRPAARLADPAGRHRPRDRTGDGGAARRRPSHNQRVGFAAADACTCRFATARSIRRSASPCCSTSATSRPRSREFARVTRAGGRVVAVEPDNARATPTARRPPGVQRVRDVAREFFAALAAARGETTDAAIGPKLPALFARHGIEPLERPAVSRVADPRSARRPPTSGHGAAAAIERSLQQAPNDAVRALGREYLDAAATLRSRSRDRRVRRSSKSRTRCSLRPLARKRSEGYEGWDDYAPFYDWENARTLGRRDVPFWRNSRSAPAGRSSSSAAAPAASDAARPRRRLARRHRSIGRRCWRAPVGASAARG